MSKFPLFSAISPITLFLSRIKVGENSNSQAKDDLYQLPVKKNKRMNKRMGSVLLGEKTDMTEWHNKLGHETKRTVQ